jgi:hypothetical protein
MSSIIARRRTRAATVLVLIGVALLLIPPAQAQTSQQPLTFFKNYFVTGDYVVRGVSLWRKGVKGKAVVQIPALGGADGVPARGDILAAFLYIQTAEKIQGSGIAHAKLNGFDFGPFTDPATPNEPGSGTIAKALNWEQATLPCWSVNFPGGRRLVTYRADVLRFLPIDTNTQKQSLTVSHVLEVPDTGIEFPDDDESAAREPANKTGPRAVGASLVVVYRERTRPFKGIVIYDGGFTKRALLPMEQRLEGFYQAKNGTSARMTHVVGDGRPFLFERVKTSGLSGLATAGATQTVTNPFASAQGPKWDNWTTSLTLAPANSSAVVNGARVVVEPLTLLSDCVSWSAMILSTPVQDQDNDSLLDVWETSSSLTDPNGVALPRLGGPGGMGASPRRKDLFIEIGYMYTDDTQPFYTYGGTAKPHHDHRPSLSALTQVAQAFARQNIQVHFDVGNNYQNSPLPPFIIPWSAGPASLARGGEFVDERVTQCPRDPNDPSVCQFSEYPGTVGWKSGFRLLRDQLLNPVGPPPGPNEDDPCDAAGAATDPACERRFDRNRKDMFHYAFFAHAIGMPKDACFLKDAAGKVVLDQFGNPQADLSCPGDPNSPDFVSDFFVPRTNSGIADFPGGDLLITLAFENADGLPIGTDYMQAGTLMHEWGHNFELTHAGPPKFPVREPNCKPNYLSVMNYLFQLRGLLLPLRTLADGSVVVDDVLGAPVPQVDYSGAPLLAIPEPNLEDGEPFTGTLPYRTGWYAPKETSYLKDQPGGAATKHCDGSDLTPEDNIPMVRIDAFSLDANKLDWQANGSLNNTNIAQDVNFNGAPPTPLNAGDNDWAFIRLQELGGRRSVGGFYKKVENGVVRYFMGPLSLDIGRGDIGRGDIGRGDIGRGDIGRGDIGRGDIGRGDIGRGDIGRGDIGRGDIGRGDIGRGDIGRGEFGGGDMDVGAANEFFLGELDFETFIAATGGLAPTPPNGLRACLTTGEGNSCVSEGTGSLPVRLNWDKPNVGKPITYRIYRFTFVAPFVPGTVPLFGEGQLIATITDDPYDEMDGPPTTYVDFTADNGINYAYYMTADFEDETGSGISNFATIQVPSGEPIP